MKRVLGNGLIVTMNQNREVFYGSVLIKDEVIERVIKHDPFENLKDLKNGIGEFDELIDCTGQLILPGLIQTHTHLTQTLFKGLGDDLQLMDWLQTKIWPSEAAHTAETNYISSKVGIGELLKGGTTTIVNMESVNHTESSFEALKEMGIRAISGKCMMDYNEGVPKGLIESLEVSLSESERLLKKWHQTHNGLIEYALAPRFVVSCSDELLKASVKMSRTYGVRLHTHASENKGEIAIVRRRTGMENIDYLKRIGFLGKHVILAHCIHLNDLEVQHLIDSETVIAHCPSSNMKLASGFAPVHAMLQRGAKVTLGADGSPCNNELNIFMEMRMAALIHKGNQLDSTIMNAKSVFEMATIKAAEALGKESEIGSVVEGKHADLITLRIDKLESMMVPLNAENVYAQIVYNASSRDVCHTLVNGALLVTHGQLVNVSEADLYLDAKKAIINFIKDPK
ncbi:guanine deaminase [Fusibacter sp. 3D3]|nr:guanine deaminase [Fusibacter sp. 3D3]